VDFVWSVKAKLQGEDAEIAKIIFARLAMKKCTRKVLTVPISFYNMRTF
jgi:hypothetical protein